jgi:hypothetical protein
MSPQDGRKPAFYAVQRELVAVLDFLQGNNVRHLNEVDIDNRDALQSAIDFNHELVVLHLLQDLVWRVHH